MRPLVAIVDDNEVTCAWVSQALTEAGFDAIAYSSSFGIQAFIRKHKPELLLLDVQMPALSGKAICNLLKSDAKTSGLRIVLHSSMSQEELKLAVLECRADGYVEKSKDPQPMITKIRSTLRSYSPSGPSAQ